MVGREEITIIVKRLDRDLFFVKIHPYYVPVGKGIRIITYRARVPRDILFDILNQYTIKSMKRLDENTFLIRAELR